MVIYKIQCSRNASERWRTDGPGDDGPLVTLSSYIEAHMDEPTVLGKTH